jgi:hypothetical protein
MQIRYIGRNDHSAMFDQEYIFLGSRKNIKNQYKIYDVPDQVGGYLCKHFPENIDKANMTGIIFKEVKKK